MAAPTDTPEEVCEVLTDLFRGRGLFAATPGSVADRIGWGARFLASDREGWSALLLRAQCEAEGLSFRARCRERGWSRSRGERAWRRAGTVIAKGLASRKLDSDTPRT